ncbi:hypothetical protein BGZ63DRAFT_400719 [Mariannaea sp. PMI_226]|nr:hypothetical protein BGZ63DRAFT_400719 [Mariannaea sp. PMI_226]
MLCPKTNILLWAIALLSLFLSIIRERFRHFLADILADSLLDFATFTLIGSVMWRRRRRPWLRWVYFSSLGCFEGRMPSGFGKTNEGGVRMLVAHVLGAFTLLGTLVPLRLDRRDMEACGFGIICLSPLRQHKSQCPFRLTMIGLVGLATIAGLAELGLYLALGHWVDLPRFWFPENLTFMQMFIHGWILSPLLDIAETMLFIV